MVLGMPMTAMSRPRSSMTLVELHRAAHAAVAADDEQDVDPELDEGVDHLPGVLVAARAAQDRAAVVVDVPDGVQVELDDALAVLRRQARVAVAEAVDVRDAVVLGELLDDPADHVVEPGAQAAAGHDADVRGVRVEVDLPARPGRLEAGQLVDGHPALQQHGDGVVHEHAVVLVDVVRRRALGGQHLRERRVVAAVTEAADAQIVELERHGGPPGVVKRTVGTDCPPRRGAVVTLTQDRERFRRWGTTSRDRSSTASRACDRRG